MRVIGFVVAYLVVGVVVARIAIRCGVPEVPDALSAGGLAIMWPGVGAFLGVLGLAHLLGRLAGQK